MHVLKWLTGFTLKRNGVILKVNSYTCVFPALKS